MTTGHLYYAFIRAINTGRRRMTNSQVIEPFVGLGFSEVMAYQAAGNVVFRADDAAAAQSQRIESALADAYGFDAPVFVRSAGEVRRIVDEQPFVHTEIAATEGRIQVAFLQEAPAQATVARIQALVPADDKVVCSGCEWYWLPKLGISDSELPVGAIETLTGAMTMRTLGTVSRMITKFSPGAPGRT